MMNGHDDKKFVIDAVLSGNAQKMQSPGFAEWAAATTEEVNPAGPSFPTLRVGLVLPDTVAGCKTLPRRKRARPAEGGRIRASF
jgi:hypothetical protein